MPTIEDIILQKDGRNISALRPYLLSNYVEDAADLILEHPGKALIVTGFYIVYASAPETDGPPGAAAIGEALSRIGYEVAYVTDKYSMDAMKSVAGDKRVIDFPVADHKESAEAARRIIETEKPSVVIAIERAGLVGDGTFRNMHGTDISEYNAKIDHLFDQHPYSVGIGDGGNEIGMGNLRDEAASIDRLPDDPCVTQTTKLMIASVSNWGGYGLAAALSLKKGENLLPSVEEENGWVYAAYETGAVDGPTGEHRAYVDGFPLDEYNSCLTDLHEHVNAALA
ncbi:MAG: DUF4392 domain-containing protein [Dehalococcoidia bacterium]|jgi:hypothetical protein|nr:DUF4392 domain-containing protein [Dehalococcoidia bacterium]